MTFDDWLDGKKLGGMELAFAKDAWKSARIAPDCSQCSNLGQIDGLSQETHCDHCRWQELWRIDHYAPPNAIVTGLAPGKDEKMNQEAPPAQGQVDVNVSQQCYAGKDNYGRPKADYLTKIAAMDDEALCSECYSMIYQSARCNNNLRADWHWMVDACYDEAKKRDDESSIYVKAYDRCYADHAG